MSAPQWVPRDRARRAVLRALEAELADARTGENWQQLQARLERLGLA